LSLAHKQEEYFTYADYCNWDDNTRWELIDGAPYSMVAPSIRHQEILGNVYIKFREYLDGKLCKVLIAAVDVRLNADKGDDTVVQPDLLIVCDEEKLADGKSVKGAPDLVVEILSPSNEKHDRVKKHAKYKEAGVKEIWYIDPTAEVVDVYKLENGKYFADTYGVEDIIPVGIFPEFEVDLKEII